MHENGVHPYEIIGTKNIMNLNHKPSLELVRRINDICVKNGLKYLEKEENSRLTPQIREMINRLEIDTKVTIHEGERHMTLLSIADSLLITHYIYSNKPTDRLKKFFENVNSTLCQPYPLPQNEIDDIWESAIDFVENNREHYSNRNDSIQLSKKEKFIEDATEQILSTYHFVTIIETKEILYYKDGVYKKDGEILIEKELENHYDYQLKINDIKEITAHIMRKTYIRLEEFDKDFNIINMKNGLYLINEDKLIPHDPNYYSINQKPFPYNPKARRKHFIKFLKEVLYPEDILTIIDILAYTFLRHNPYELYFILVGLGANGKSVLMGVLTELHGRRNVSNVPLSSILNNRFALAGMDGRDVNIDTELSSAIIKDISILKKLTGQLPIPIERKNQQPYETILHAKLFFNANALPPTVDHTDAHYRREIIISFPNQFEEGKNADTKLLSRLTTEEELSGIFNILMKGLRRILKNERIYLNQKTIQERRERHELIIDPITAFMKASIAEDAIETDSVTKDDLHIAYVKYCKFHQLPYESKENFGKILKKPPHNLQEGRETKKGKDGKRKTIWEGIELVDWINIDPEQDVLVLEGNYTN